MSRSRRSHVRVVMTCGITSVVLVGILGVSSWDSLYTHLFLDPQLIGTWQLDLHRSHFSSVSPPATVDFRSNGNCEFQAWGSRENISTRITYRISNGTVSLDLSGDHGGIRYPIPEAYSYRLDGRNGLILQWKGSSGTAYYMRED